MYQGMFNKINGVNKFYMREEEWYLGALVWLVGGVGLWYLVVRPYLRWGNSKTFKMNKMIFMATILGFTSYAIFNFTNYFLIKKY